MLFGVVSVVKAFFRKTSEMLISSTVTCVPSKPNVFMLLHKHLLKSNEMNEKILADFCDILVGACVFCSLWQGSSVQCAGSEPLCERMGVITWS